MIFKQVNSRICIDSAIFTFGILDNSNTEQGFKLFCAGADSYSVDEYNPLSTDQLIAVIREFEGLSRENPKKTIKFKIGSFTSVRFKFKKYDEKKGFKVKAYLTGFLYFSSSGFFSCYCSERVIQNLIANLQKCINSQLN